MTIEELQKITHLAFYRIVRMADPLQLDEFLQAKVVETMPADANPAGWPDFWWESIAVEIQSGVMARKEHLLGFSAKWLEANKQLTWNEVITQAGGNIVPL